MKYRKWIVCMGLGVMLLELLVGCAAPAGRQNSTDPSIPKIESEMSQPLYQTDATIPFSSDGTEETIIEETNMTENHLQGGCAESGTLCAVRAQDISQAKLELIMANHPGCGDNTLSMIALQTEEELELFLQEAASSRLREHCRTYDADFFHSYDLLIIPRVSNTGSVTYTAELSMDEKTLTVMIQAFTPEIATMDMANWFLLLPISKAETAGREISAVLQGASFAQPSPAGTVAR